AQDKKELVERTAEEAIEHQAPPVRGADRFGAAGASDRLEEDRGADDPKSGEGKRRDRRQRELAEDRKEREAGLGADQGEMRSPGVLRVRAVQGNGIARTRAVAAGSDTEVRGGPS